MKYRPERDLPKFALEHKTTSPTELAKIVLQERNTEIKPQAVTMWFKRHPTELIKISAQIVESEIDKQVVDDTIFRNGTFEQLPSVKNWLLEMQDRKLDTQVIHNRIGALKRCCKGQDLPEEQRVMKHPDRLTIDDARNYVRTRRQQGFTMNVTAVSLRDFLLSKGKIVGKKISASPQKGKYSKLYLPPEIIRKFLNLVKSLNPQIHAIDLFELKNATRINAILDARIEDINDAESYITVYDKGRRSKYPRGHPWDKHLDTELKADIQPYIGDRAEGKIFNVDSAEVRDINKACLDILIKEYAADSKLVRLLKMARKIPTHFLRHEFFQHCLHTSGWEYGMCAALGGSTVASLEESYGQPPKAIVKKWGEEWLNKITV